MKERGERERGSSEGLIIHGKKIFLPTESKVVTFKGGKSEVLLIVGRATSRLIQTNQNGRRYEAFFTLSNIHVRQLKHF